MERNMLDVVRIETEVAKLMAETVKINREAEKLNREQRWFPVQLTAIVLGAAAAIAGAVVTAIKAFA